MRHWYIYKADHAWQVFQVEPGRVPEPDHFANFTSHEAALAYAISRAYPTAKDTK